MLIPKLVPLLTPTKKPTWLPSYKAYMDFIWQRTDPLIKQRWVMFNLSFQPRRHSNIGHKAYCFCGVQTCAANLCTCVALKAELCAEVCRTQGTLRVFNDGHVRTALIRICKHLDLRRSLVESSVLLG